MLSVLHFFFQCFISLFSLYKMNLSPARKRNNRGLKTRVGRTAGLCVYSLRSTPPEQTQPNAEGKKKKVRIQSPSFSGADYCAAGVGKENSS